MSDEELLIKASIEQMAAPLQRLLDQMLGPAATEVGLTLRDFVKVWRVKRQFDLLQEVKRLIDESGKDVKPIATRLFFPVLEAASVEQDDEMQTRWAALIANEATIVGSVHPSYINILKQLAPDDARLLDKICDWCRRHKIRKLTADNETRERDRDMMGILKSSGDSLDNLVRLGLIQSGYGLDGSSQKLSALQRALSGRDAYLDSWYVLSDFAVRFVRACRAPRSRPRQ